MTTIGINNIASREDIFLNYVRAVEAAGGTPKELKPTVDPEELRLQTGDCDGYIFIGGPDFDPARYGGVMHPQVKMLDPLFEEFCFKLAEMLILNGSKPCLGVCLGAQLINIVHGGTLHEDLHSQIDGAYWHSRPEENQELENMHRIMFTEDNPLAEIFGVNWLCVNSSHHQAVKKLGRGLKACAFADDGIMEAICCEDLKKRFLVGVQWHPERLFDKVQGHINIFKALVSAAECSH